MQLTLGPIQYYWPRNDIHSFYEAMLHQPIERIYLGEVVCGKRHELRANDWIELAQQLQSYSEKSIVLSTLTLLESNADLNLVKRLCENDGLLVEANDMSAVQILSQAKLPFVCGSAINIYNHHTLEYLQSLGMQRWVVPVEMGKLQLQTIMQALDHELEVEVFAYGHMPLAYSARCFTARHLNMDKDSCGYRCIDYPHGLALNTQENEHLFVINGIQTLSGQPVNLLSHWQDFDSCKVTALRLSPQWQAMQDIIRAFDAIRLDNKSSLEGGVDGYWLSKPGLDIIAKAG
ncbi:U32 family peptidase [Simiduia litorea]|uniref:U32 family peptidase n=1 Tax=Simiduia litorea TaxID=1435348 RepID=UPI0036F32783